eukprot:TRINITY_DN7627_c0_g1_i2.p1 TRINITY_DN7627_c0_g1~~TRINITY_DN7627_c0_g1_i2.p1  ORF type:complete len:166 (+),score=56.43 TRINITY_DN7627_c0_g1_i2:172-669(+)
MSQLMNEGDHGQPEEDWKQRYLDPYDKEPPSDASGGRTVTLEETMTVVKEKMWTFGDAALKGVAEVLVGFGISPTVLGYSEEDLMEDEELEDARMRIEKDKVLTNSSFARRSEENMSRRRAEEEVIVEENPDAYIPDDRRFGMSPGAWRGSNENFLDAGEDKKDK